MTVVTILITYESKAIFNLHNGVAGDKPKQCIMDYRERIFRATET